MVRKGRFIKLEPHSDGYKKGYRYIDLGEKETSKTRLLKTTPQSLIKQVNKTMRG